MRTTPDLDISSYSREWRVTERAALAFLAFLALIPAGEEPPKPNPEEEETRRCLVAVSGSPGWSSNRSLAAQGGVVGMIPEGGGSVRGIPERVGGVTMAS